MKSIIPVILVLVMVVLGCNQFKNRMSRSSSSFEQYKGSLTELLPAEFSGSVIKFKLSATQDAISEHPGAKEAKRFTYLQEAAGVSVQVAGALVNYPTSQLAEKRLREIAADVGATVIAKGKWQRFTSKDSKTVGWTNGSVMALAQSTAAKPASNFEEYAPF